MNLKKSIRITTRLFSLVYCIGSFSTIIYTFDEVHFYKPPLFLWEPRFERSGLSSLAVYVAYGTTKHGRVDDHRVPLLNIYGLHALQKSTVDVLPAVTDQFTPALNELAALPLDRTGLALYSLKTKLRVVDAVIDAYQNMTNGFFFHLQAPFRSVAFDPITWCDLTPEDNPHKALVTPLSNDISTLVNNRGINDTLQTEQGCGDPGLALGWTVNYEETEYLDFIDLTVQGGMTAPLSKKSKACNLISLPLGYNGHTSYFFEVSSALGLYNWITAGLHMSASVFNDHVLEQRVKTNHDQSGLLLFQKRLIDEEWSPLLVASAYLKADHVCRGFSVLLGYSYTTQGRSTWLDLDSGNMYIFCDPRLAGFNMSTMHLNLEYDFATPAHPKAPVISMVCSFPFAGEHIFVPNMVGGGLGLSCTWRW